MTITPEDAKNFLNSPVYQQIFDEAKAKLIRKLETLDISEESSDLTVIKLQQLHSLKRDIEVFSKKDQKDNIRKLNNPAVL